MTVQRVRGLGAWWRLACIGVLAIGVTTALYVAGRVHQPDYSFSLLGTDPVPVKSLLATIATHSNILQNRVAEVHGKIGVNCPI